MRSGQAPPAQVSVLRHRRDHPRIGLAIAFRKNMRWRRFPAAAILCLPAFAAAPANTVITGPAYRLSLETSFAPVVRRCLPAVVNVSSTRLVRKASNSPILSDPFFRELFGERFLHQLQAPREEREESLGSGVIVSPDGYILTNDHVVDGADHVKVTLDDHREFEARIVGRDSKTDIAVLKVGATKLPVLPLGDSSRMQPGDFVLAIGDPFGLSETVTMGIVSAIGRGNLGIEDYEDFIQTDAAINPGNSGGALIDANGTLIGINTAILSGGGGSQGVGFAIPIDMARQVMDQILKNGRVIRAWMGMVTQPVTPAIADAFHLSGEPRGALVADVAPDSPAAKAGLATGDIVLEMNGRALPNARDLSLRVAMMAPGSTIRVRALRGGTEREIPVTLAEQPSEPRERKAPVVVSAAPRSLLDGVDIAELTPDVSGQLHLPAATAGVVVGGVDSASLAAEAGLKPGDVIEQVNHRPVSNIPGFETAVRAAGSSPLLLLVNRGGTTQFLVIEPE
jgi:serine protease Do